MGKIPCRKCPGCGLYHGISIRECNECGRDLKTAPILLMETDEIPAELFGEIDEDAPVYVQKCSACGALNFTSNIEEPVRVCYNCHKTRVASIKPTEYIVDDIEEKPTDNVIQNDLAGETNSREEITDRIFTPINSNERNDDDDDDDDDDESAQWQGILGNIRQTVGSAPLKKDSITKAETPSVADTILSNDSDDDEDEDDDIADWSGILGGKSSLKKTEAEESKKAITLTAIRYGRLSFTIEAKENKPYMLGRSANQSDFLASDGRVGNEHCYIFFRDGFWHVKDNHSANGTAVNSRDIGLNGEHILNDGDELKLGHHPDSMAFRITI